MTGSTQNEWHPRPGYYTDGLRGDARFDPIARLRQLEDSNADLTFRLSAMQRELAAIRELLEQR